jgi:CubicO group peptidase (beta-lactamase class C family)
MSSALSASLLLCLVATSAARKESPIDAKAVDALVAEARKAFDVPGVAVAIVRDGKVIYLKGIGVKELGKTDPITPDTLFPLASCTKAFTTAAMAILVDKSRIDWDDPVRKHVDFFHLSDPTADADVRLRDLVCHRIGLAGHDLLWYRVPWKPEDAIRRIAHVKLDKPFRTAFQYQSTMFTAAGYGVGTASGSTWKEFVQANLLDPLDMKSTVFTTPDLDKANIATPHLKTAQGEVKTIPHYQMANPDPACSIYSSARDLANWVRFQLSDGTWNGKRIVSAKNLSETHTPQIAIRLEGAAKAMNPETHLISYGMGWVIQDYRGYGLVSHAGAIDGFRVHLTLVPEAKLGMVILSNLHQTRMNLPLSNSIIDLLLGLPKKDWNGHFLDLVKKDEADAKERARQLEAKRHLDTKPSRELGEYSGTYENAAYGTATIKLDAGKLLWRWNSFGCPLEHFHYDTFTARNDQLGDPQMVFTFGANGEVAAMQIGGIVGVEFKKSKQK